MENNPAYHTHKLPNQPQPDEITREEDADDADDGTRDTYSGPPSNLAHAILVTIIASAVFVARLAVIIGILVAMFHHGQQTDMQMPSFGNWSTELNGTTTSAMFTIFDSTNPLITDAIDEITFGGKGQKPGEFHSPFGLVVSPSNEIFVTDMQNQRIQVFDMKGTFLRKFSTEDKKPRDIALDRNGILWVLASEPKNSRNTILKYNTEGKLLTTVKSISSARLAFGIALDTLSDNVIVTLVIKNQGKGEAKVFKPDGSLVRTFGQNTKTPLSVVVDKDGNIFITDASTQAHFVFKYANSGTFLVKFGGKGSGPGSLKSPFGICVDSLDRIIVADSGNSRVEMFTRGGDHIRTIANITQPSHVATGGQGQLVVTSALDTVTIFNKY